MEKALSDELVQSLNEAIEIRKTAKLKELENRLNSFSEDAKEAVNWDEFKESLLARRPRK